MSLRDGNDVFSRGAYSVSVLSTIIGGLFIVAGLVTILTPRSWSEYMMAFHSAEIAALPRANPLRWFHLFWRFVAKTPVRKMLWGADQIGTGVAFILGQATLAIAFNGLLGVAVLVTRSLRSRVRGPRQ